MAFNNFQEFIHYLEKNGELVKIKTEVSPDLEITEITNRVTKKYGKALFFENVKGSHFPVVTNTFGTFKRIEMAFGRSADEIAKKIEKLTNTQVPEGIANKIKLIPKLIELAKTPPKLVTNAPCQEVVHTDPDLSIIPVLKCWPEDGGKFITLPLVITKSLEDSKRNMGMYRIQIYDKNTTGMHWHIHKDGANHFSQYLQANKRMEAAIAIGSDPATIYSSTAPLPPGIDEFLLAGFLREKAIEIVRCKTVDIEVPAEAEFIIEGYLDPQERKPEGPFGDHTGFYSPVDEYPVFHVTCITHRKNAVYPTTVVGPPPMEDCYLAKATERIFLPLIKMIVPEIVDMNLPIEGVFHNCAIVSIKKSYPMHAQKVMHALWGIGQMMNTKIIIVMDSDVDVQDLRSVAWKAFNNVDPKRDLTITSGPLDVLDHSSPHPLHGSKLGIDATGKIKGETTRPWPDEIKMSEEIINLVNSKWKDYGIT
ncbi:MAG: menaquinone biosynthesis decarboxylase [Deltaproteobacteria bacterium]|nr:menaquinone biosynthesis decarboxylase [Deltaproteobacteria bacterium]